MRTIIYLLSLIFSFFCYAPQALAVESLSSQTPTLRSKSTFDAAHFIAQGVPAVPVQKAFQFLQKNPNIVTNNKYISVVDFTLASTEKRYYLLNLETGSVRTYWVAHGQGSGMLFATKFSNTVDSKQSSLGLYLTSEIYYGKHGKSMRLHGYEATNSNAYDRAIVVHGADYVSAEFIKQEGRLGRSWGCPALSREVSSQIIDLTVGGSILVAYKDPSKAKETEAEPLFQPFATMLPANTYFNVENEVFVPDANEDLANEPQPRYHYQAIQEE